MAKLFISLLMALAISTPALAADSSSGCGPAWYVFKDKSLVSSFLRVVTNGALFPLVTLGMTFGTSNCGKHKIVDADKRSEHLATVTFEKLRQNAAQGDGVFLDAYARTFECELSALPAFKTAVQSHYQEIFKDNASPSHIVESTKGVVAADLDLARLCPAAA